MFLVKVYFVVVVLCCLTKRDDQQEEERRMGRLKENVPPQLLRKPSTPDIGLVSKLGQYEQKRMKLREERKQEYNQLLAEVRIHLSGPLSTVHSCEI